MLETDRLILRQWSDNDLVPFSEINRNKEVMEHFPSILTHEETSSINALFQNFPNSESDYMRWN